MSSIAISSFGTKLKRGAGDATSIKPETFTTIADVRSMTWNMTAKVDEVTTHSSSTPFREYISSLIDPGSVTFNINFLPTDTTQGYTGGLFEDFSSRTKSNYEWVFPDTDETTWAFAATVADFKVSAATDGVLEVAVTLKLSGEPSFA